MARVDPVPQKAPLLTARLSDKADVWGCRMVQNHP